MMDVLVLRALGVGDLCTAVPALHGLRAFFPGARISLAAPEWLRPLVELTGCVDDVLPLDGRTGLSARTLTVAEPVRVAVNLHGRGPQSHELLRRTRPDRMLAFACPAAGFLDGPPHPDEAHEVRRWCELLRWYAIPAEESDLGLAVPDRPPLARDVTIVHPGGTSAARWPAARFAAVAQALIADGQDVFVTGTAADQPAAAALAAVGAIDVTGRTGLAELAALVAHARLVISGDTGIAHLASAYAVPSVVLFDRVGPDAWGPPDHPRHQALRHPSGRVTALRPAEVLAAAGRALAREELSCAYSESTRSSMIRRPRWSTAAG